MTTTAAFITPGVHEHFPLELVPTDDAGQSRVAIRPATVREYAKAMARQAKDGGLRFPALLLFTDGKHFWVGDGFHRTLAARQAGFSDFPAEVRSGTARDALLSSISANANHGLPRTNADKRKAVTLLLTDSEWLQWSDGEIARLCQVSQVFVSKLRKSASHNGYEIPVRKVRRGDTVYEMQKRNGSSEPATPPSPPPTTEPVADSVGIPIPAQTANVFACTDAFAAAEELHVQLTEQVIRLATQPGGVAYCRHLVRRVENGLPFFYSPELKQFATKLSTAAPYCCHCPRCQAGNVRVSHCVCTLCAGKGWLTKGEFEACSHSERQVLDGLRKPG
jgi:hypothetical protein